MTDPPPPSERAAAVMPGQGRRVTVPGPQTKQRRGGLLVLGLVLVFGAGAGFWFILQSVDQRAEYLVAARTIERWEVAAPSDFAVVEAYVGTASALTGDRAGAVVGLWATGRIPAGTLVTEGMFEAPPLSGEGDSDSVLIQVSLPSGDAPFGTLDTGDTVALLGRETEGLGGEAGPLGLIGVLQLEFVQGDNIYYVVAPAEALAIKNTIDRYSAASDRTMLKLGFDLAIEDLVAALDAQAASVPPAASEASTEAGTGAEPVGGQ